MTTYAFRDEFTGAGPEVGTAWTVDPSGAQPARVDGKYTVVGTDDLPSSSAQSSSFDLSHVGIGESVVIATRMIFNALGTISGGDIVAFYGGSLNNNEWFPPAEGTTSFYVAQATWDAWQAAKDHPYGGILYGYDYGDGYQYYWLAYPNVALGDSGVVSNAGGKSYLALVGTDLSLSLTLSQGSLGNLMLPSQPGKIALEWNNSSWEAYGSLEAPLPLALLPYEATFADVVITLTRTGATTVTVGVTVADYPVAWDATVDSSVTATLDNWPIIAGPSFTGGAQATVEMTPVAWTGPFTLTWATAPNVRF